MEQLLGETELVLSNAIDEAGLDSLCTPKVTAAEQRIQKKLANDSHALLARNFRQAEGKEECLYTRGKACVDRAEKVLEHLGLLKDEIGALQCKDENSLEYNPGYLLRAYEDCQRAGLNLPPTALFPVVRRQALMSLREGNLCGAISTLNEDIEMACGICLLKKHPTHLSLLQSEGVCDIISEVLNSTEALSVDIQFVMESLARSIKGEGDLTQMIQHVKEIASPDDYEEDSVDAAIKAIATPAPENRCAEQITRVFSTTGGKNLLFAARQHCTQRSIEIGCDS